MHRHVDQAPSTARTPHAPASQRRPPASGLPTRLRDAIEPLPDIDDPAFAEAFDRYADCRVVLLGEASHGTSEFYRARAAITKRLVERHGFRIVAVEADWPDAAVIDRHVRHRAPNAEGPPPFARFPTWMWRNAEVAALFRWMRHFNEAREARDRAGVYGLDLYSLSTSMRAVIDYLDDVDPATAALARERYACLTPWAKDPAHYGLAALTHEHARCETAVVAMLRDMLEKRLEFARRDGADAFEAEQNARLVANAENYYRAMYRGAAESWNVRDAHMAETLLQVLRARGETSRAVVWAHNSHIGDARFTEMGRERGEFNLGQLCREHFGDDAALIGFGTHTGTVAAASDWDSPMRVMQVKPSMTGSVEQQFFDAGEPCGVLHLRGADVALRRELDAERLERFIGVIYRPDTERWSHYAEVSLPRQFDAYVWFETTHAVDALEGPHAGGVPETYPFGV
ncbi:erythromycin esterase family protein [Lysobacter sp. TY2-98]|uniref:erythromycin esterase family protein n=1 Tax=Lysobacter sp. TY2-98 TaxID=2290922 RepID=UPI000E209E78|nr:erythromycin esterase family protein [Lysobacter sp. TY2-98]AXK73111.1 erythromycin esterase family protein [Lysobacter sp. TY2-98]